MTNATQTERMPMFGDAGECASPEAVYVVWVEEQQEPIAGTGQPDLGGRPRMRTVRVANAALWANKPTAVDVEKARAYAKVNGYTVVRAESSAHAKQIAIDAGA